MNDKQIEAFLMICEMGSMNRAAEKLYISQPALKKRIDTLEEELNTVLLHRNSGGCELTSAGKVFWEGIQPIYSQLGRLLAKVKNAGQQQILRICTLPDISMVEQDTWLIGFARSNPDVACRQIALPTSEWMDALLTGRVDLFQSFYTKERLERYRQMGLCFAPKSYKVKLACVLSSQHPLAKHKTIAFDELRGYSIFAGPLIYHYSDLRNYAQDRNLDLQCDESAGKRYEMMNKCEAGAIYIHPMSYAGELKPLAVLPLKGFTCLSGWIWKDESSEVIQRFLKSCDAVV